jgi:hypothetical protein
MKRLRRATRSDRLGIRPPSLLKARRHIACTAASRGPSPTRAAATAKLRAETDPNQGADGVTVLTALNQGRCGSGKRTRIEDRNRDGAGLLRRHRSARAWPSAGGEGVCALEPAVGTPVTVAAVPAGQMGAGGSRPTRTHTDAAGSGCSSCRRGSRLQHHEAKSRPLTGRCGGVRRGT